MNFIIESHVNLSFASEAFSSKLSEAKTFGKEGMFSFLNFIFDYISRISDRFVLADSDLSKLF